MFLYDREMKKKNTYIVYVDESNISASAGHSVYTSIFVMYVNKEIVSNQIIFIEKYLKISYTHWVDMPWKLRLKFAERIKKLDFICKTSLYKNPIIQEDVLEGFLNKITPTKSKTFKIIIDGKKGNKYKERLKIKLKNNGMICSNLIFVDDKGESLVRFADFMAGLIRSYIDGKNKYSQYMFDILKDKIKMLN